MPRDYDSMLEDLLKFALSGWTRTREIVGENEIVTFSSPADPVADRYTVTFIGETTDTQDKE